MLNNTVITIECSLEILGFIKVDFVPRRYKSFCLIEQIPYFFI